MATSIVKTISPAPIRASWVLFKSVCYLTGRGLSFGDPVLPQAATDYGKYSINVDVVRTPTAAVCNDELETLADDSMEHVFVGSRLESVYNPPKLLREAARKLKVGGHLIVNVPNNHEEPGYCLFNKEGIAGLIEGTGKYKTKYFDIHPKEGILFIGKKLSKHPGRLVERTPDPHKRACVARYGAMGDMIMVTPLLKQLKEDGYHVTVNATPYSIRMLDNNPYIDNLIVQEREAIPNPALGPYWDMWRKEYDRYINLSESIEGGLLKVENRPDFFTHKSWRHKTCNVNYYDRTLELGGYPEIKGRNGELFFSSSEERKAKEFFDKLKDKFVVLWALHGSSHHKIYPMMEPTMREWLETHRDSVLITVGDKMAQLLEFEHPQAIPKSDIWSIRESLIATKYVDAVIGPESMITNASGCYDTPKIVFLSHSSAENLTKYWKNCYSLEPDTTIAPCYPCHMLHYSPESCPIGMIIEQETQTEVARGPICAMNAIAPTKVLGALEEIYAQSSV